MRLPSLRPRLVLFATIAVGVAAWRLASPAPGGRSLDSLAGLLGEAAGGHVETGDILWSSRGGIIDEAVRGRPLLFLASASPGAPRDVYRAWVRVSPDGVPLAVARAYPITTTPLGDETSLTGDDPAARRFAAFATMAYDAVAATTLLDLDGDDGMTGGASALERVLSGMTNVLETGSPRGIGKTVFTFEHPPAGVRLGFDSGFFSLTPSGGAPTRFDLTGRVLVGRPEDAPVIVQAVPRLRKPAVLWAVDTARGFVGPGPIAWLEDRFFGARDALRQARYYASGPAAVTVDVLPPPATPPESPSPHAPASHGQGPRDEPRWPPAPVGSLWKNPDAAEGVWTPIDYAFLHKPSGSTDDAPPYFYHTVIRPDAHRPYVTVHVVAMDMRQLEVDMEGGVEDPKPLTGAPSKGRIPRDPGVSTRVVAAFNGAFKTTHGAYGMMVDRRVLLPPKPGAATVVVTDDLRVGIGAWPADGRTPADLLSYRQNLELLVDHGVVNPSGRTVWGFQLAGTTVLTERSGACVTDDGHLFYLWGDDLSGPSLGAAMKQAGCAAGIHLDMNPTHTGLVFTGVRDVAKKDYDTRLLTPQMGILPERYLEWSPKDFFYVMLRPAGPPATGDVTNWSPDGGTQPAPAFRPAVYSARVASDGDVAVTLSAFDRRRVTFRLRAGDGEGEPGLAHDLDPGERNELLAVLGLGSTRPARPLGLRVGGVQGAPFRGQNGYVNVDHNGHVALATEADAGTTDAVELPLIASAGVATSVADERGPLRGRTALCITSGYLLVASGRSDADRPLATALLRAGCETVVALDRGAHDETTLVRRGRATVVDPPAAHATLYVVAAREPPRAFVWEAAIPLRKGTAVCTGTHPLE